MKILIKRVYEPTTKGDGFRVLVDRLWPRGVSKADAKIDVWLKEITPSSELRNWFHRDKNKLFEEFYKKYEKELIKISDDTFEDLRDKDKITLVTAVKDIEHSHIPTLKSFLEKKL